MRRITRQLDRDTAQIEPTRKFTPRRELIENRQHQAAKVGEDVNHTRAASAVVGSNSCLINCASAVADLEKS